MKNRIIDLIYLTAGCFLLPIALWRRIASGRPIGNPAERLLGRVPRVSGPQPVIWFHAVSVGEVNQLDSVIRHVRQRCPESRIVISATTATGLQLARTRYPDLTLFAFPMDFTWAMNNVLRRIRPALLVLTELELWPNLLDAAWRREIPVAVINGRLSDRSFRGYRRMGRLARTMFSRLTCVVTQDGEYAHRFERLGTPGDRIHEVGSLKYDHARQQAEHCRTAELTRTLANQLGLNERQTLWVAGSTQSPEEEMAGTVYLSLIERYPELRLAIAPRHPHRAGDIERSLGKLGIPVIRRSGVSELTLATQPVPPVLLLDTIGELGNLWALSSIAFVGGSFGNRGGQNMLEPAAARNATCFGPNTWNFSAIVADMIAAGAGKQVGDCSELEAFVAECLGNMPSTSKRGVLAGRYVDGRCGATGKTALLLSRLIVRSAKQGSSRAA